MRITQETIEKAVTMIYGYLINQTFAHVSHNETQGRLTNFSTNNTLATPGRWTDGAPEPVRIFAHHDGRPGQWIGFGAAGYLFIISEGDDVWCTAGDGLSLYVTAPCGDRIKEWFKRQEASMHEDIRHDDGL